MKKLSLNTLMLKENNRLSTEEKRKTLGGVSSSSPMPKEPNCNMGGSFPDAFACLCVNGSEMYYVCAVGNAYCPDVCRTPSGFGPSA